LRRLPATILPRYGHSAAGGEAGQITSVGALSVTGDGRYQRFDVQFAENVNLFHSPLKAGATVRYRTTAGGWAVAEVAEVGLHTLTLQIRSGTVGSETQPTGGADRP